MGKGHHSSLYVHGSSPLHEVRPECKIVAVVLFVFAVVATPREQVWAFGCYALALLAAAVVGRLPLLRLAKRLVIELPFLAFAVLLPFVAHGEQVAAGPLRLSVDGLWGGWNIVAKGTLGVAASVVLTATTTMPDLLTGLERLRLPRMFTTVMVLMARFGAVVTDQARRMQIARTARGYDPRWFWQVRALAFSAGTLFIRSYERGERVYLAMLARGYTGAFPAADDGRAPGAHWAAALVLPLVAAGIAYGAWVTRM